MDIAYTYTKNLGKYINRLRNHACMQEQREIKSGDIIYFFVLAWQLQVVFLHEILLANLSYR